MTIVCRDQMVDTSSSGELFTKCVELFRASLDEHQKKLQTLVMPETPPPIITNTPDYWSSRLNSPSRRAPSPLQSDRPSKSAKRRIINLEVLFRPELIPGKLTPGRRSPSHQTFSPHMQTHQAKSERAWEASKTLQHIRLYTLQLSLQVK
jgi:hypothetical protein